MTLHRKFPPQSWIVLLVIASTPLFGQTESRPQMFATLRVETGNSTIASESSLALSRSEAVVTPAPAVTLIKPAGARGKQHRSFFDRKNDFLIAASAATISLDGLSTQRFLNYPGNYEKNPIARPFVRSRPGSAAYFGISMAGEVALMRLAHRRNHHRLERLIPVMVVASETFMVVHNYSLRSH